MSTGGVLITSVAPWTNPTATPTAEAAAQPGPTSGYRLKANTSYGADWFAFAGAPVDVVSMFPSGPSFRVNVMIHNVWKMQGASGTTGPWSDPVGASMDVSEIEPNPDAAV